MAPDRFACPGKGILNSADLVLTYATNTLRFDEHLLDALIYSPRFVQLTRCR